MRFDYPGDVSPGPIVSRILTTLRSQTVPTEQKRLTAIPDLDALAVLGYSTDEDGQTACVTGPARRLARLVEQATAELRPVIVRAEWNAIADVMNGCADLYDYADSDVPALLMVRANLADSPEIGEKWGVDVADLCRRLEALTPLHGEAILCAVRWAWRHCDDWDHTRDEWWEPAFRRLKSRAK